ncbi:MAG TPA: glycosyltransferase family 2 protein [Nitrosopumilaceae archaeon]|nr:glycosyltransferase family 2 protein [Nitrosopumilaceae archaeon]
MKNDSSEIPDETFVSIIILNYNGGNVILECLESIFKTEKCKFEVIVIDNGSSDNSHFNCKQKFPSIILIENKENLGMTARNIGISISKGNYVVFLDSDTVVKPDWLNQFVKSHMQHGEGLYQPKFLEKERPDIINSAGNMINIFGLAFLQGRGETDSGQYEDFKNICYTGGACTFTSSETIKKIGDVDPIFFAYHDDVDYGWRGLLLGVSSYYEPKVIVYHYGSPTLKWSKKKFFLLERNRWICLLTLYSRGTMLKIFPLLIIVEFGMLLFFLSKKMGLVKIKTFFSLIKMNKEIDQRRKRINMNRKISDKQVITNFTDNFHLPISTTNTKTSHRVSFIITLLSKTARKIINS